MGPINFQLGQIVATPGAVAALAETRELIGRFLVRHQTGDWGVVSTHDQQANNRALQDGSRIFSAYLLRDQTKIWIITSAVGDDGQRESTAILLPSEY